MTSKSDKLLITDLKRRVKAARKFPHNTCPASRHLHLMAEALAKGERYHMFEEEPEHCAITMLAVLESLWKLRTYSGWPAYIQEAKFKLTDAETSKISASLNPKIEAVALEMSKGILRKRKQK
jgi:hypothetical protein